MPLELTKPDVELLSKLTLGERILYVRRLHEVKEGDPFTIKSLSERVGISTSNLSGIERGQSKNPSFGTIVKIARELNLSLDLLAENYAEPEVQHAG